MGGLRTKEKYEMAIPGTVTNPTGDRLAAQYPSGVSHNPSDVCIDCVSYSRNVYLIFLRLPPPIHKHVSKARFIILTHALLHTTSHQPPDPLCVGKHHFPM